MDTIKFGTDGWRAVIAKEFTFENVCRVGKAIAIYLKKHGKDKHPLIIGYDPRFLADEFAMEIGKICSKAGIRVLISDKDAATPVIAFSVRDKKACGAVMLTASHNPSKYLGIKFIPEYAGPASPEIAKEIEGLSNSSSEPEPAAPMSIEKFDPNEAYERYITKFADLETIKKAKLNIVYDPMHGSGRVLLPKLLAKAAGKLTLLNENRDVLFGGKNPEPAEENLKELSAKVVELNADLGLATDGDADRFGVVDRHGSFFSANQVLSLVFWYLVEHKKFTGSVVRSLATTHMIDRIAEKHRIKVHETPVGFKYIAEIMMKEEVILGGEESGGLSIKGHIPEKDGLLADLLITEMVAKTKKPVDQLWQELISKFGDCAGEKVNLPISAPDKEKLVRFLKTSAPEALGGQKVTGRTESDGVKLLLEDGWVAVRPSGTEDIARVYFESGSEKKVADIEKDFGRILQKLGI
ncbi:MAG: phosphoglucomutase/phosphomannomutase family protein [Candidatus Margulisiibacteriota bacterium]